MCLFQTSLASHSDKNISPTAAVPLSKISAANATTTASPLQIDGNIGKLSPQSHSVQHTNSAITNPKKTLWQKLLPFPIGKSTEQLETKEFKVPYSLNPGISHQFSAFVSFNKVPLIGSALGSSSGSFSGSSSELSMTATASATDTASASHLAHEDTVNGSQSDLIDVNREQLIFDSQQHDYSGDTSPIDEIKQKWIRIWNGPRLAWHKVQKFGVDMVGLGPLYGTGQFKHQDDELQD